MCAQFEGRGNWLVSSLRQCGTLTLLEWQSCPLDLMQLLKTRLKKAGEGEREKENTKLAKEKAQSKIRQGEWAM